MKAKIMKAKIKLLEAKIELLQAKLDRMKTEEALIEINGDGLQPHLEEIMWDLLDAIRKRAAREQSNGHMETLFSPESFRFNYSGKWIDFHKDGRIVITDDHGKQLGKF